MRVSKRALPWLMLVLTACPAHEGPIDVLLDGIDGDEVEALWAEAGSEDFVPCENGTTDPAAHIGCGPYGVGQPGDYVVRVLWGEQQAERAVTLERDGSYQANVAITFSPTDFE